MLALPFKGMLPLPAGWPPAPPVVLLLLCEKCDVDELMKSSVVIGVIGASCSGATDDDDEAPIGLSPLLLFLLRVSCCCATSAEPWK